MPAPVLRLVAAALLLGASFITPALAAPVDVVFLPPEIPAQEVCVAKKADPEVVSRWQAWDGVSVPEGDPELVVRDARRLRDLNPIGNFERVDQMLAVVAEMPAPKVPDTTLDRINLYLKAGKIPQLRETGIIDRLEADEAALAPKALTLLATLYIDGIVVKKDPDKGLGYLTRAAMGGNADALLRLATMNIEGQEVPGWDLDPKLAVTMAFGALVGKLDADICDRIGRIAREYSKGIVVKQDHDVSEQWLRLAADLGDPSAAWKVAQLHLESELIVKDNDRLLKYLNMASDRGVAAAQVELGKFYEAGALVDKDTDRAELLYASASDLAIARPCSGSRRCLKPNRQILKSAKCTRRGYCSWWRCRSRRAGPSPSSRPSCSRKRAAGPARPRRRPCSNRALRLRTPIPPRSWPSSCCVIATYRACSNAPPSS